MDLFRILCYLAVAGWTSVLSKESVIDELGLDQFVLPTVGNDTMPRQASLARGFGDDIFRDIGCEAGIFRSLESYMDALGMSKTTAFLGPRRTFETDDGRTEITYFDFGPTQTKNGTEEKAVLFLAGLGSLMRSWSPVLLQGLASNQRIIMLDYPGQGESKVRNSTDNPLPQYTIEYMADSAMKLLDSLSLGQGQTSVIGRSMGSIVALQMGAAHGSRLDKIIPVSNVVLNTGPRSAELFKEAKTNLDQTKIYYPITTGCDVAQWVCYKEEFTRMYRESDEMSFKTSSSMTSLQRIALNQFINSNQTENFRSIRNPVFAIQGQLDTTAPVGNLITLANLIKDFRWQLFKKAGHAVTDEYIDYIVLSIQAFLSDLGIEEMLTGLFPEQSWYWKPYSQGGSCLNPILNCNPYEGGEPQPTESPQTNGAGGRSIQSWVPPHIAIGGTGVASLETLVGN